jgi:hypothetical protein
MNDAKWKQLADRLGGWAAALVAGLNEADRRLAFLAAQGLRRRPTGRTPDASRLSTECALEAVLQRLLAARGGDREAAQAYERLVREGYVAHREESMDGFAAGLDGPARLEVAALACQAHRQGRLPPREAVTQALRVAFDRAHHPEVALRTEAARTLAGVGQQVELSPALRQAVFGFVAAHLGDLDGLLRAC